VGVDLLLAELGSYALPGAALVVSMVAVALSAYMGTRSASGTAQVNRVNDLKDQLDDCQEKIEKLEDKITDCEKDRSRLERQNLSLMQRVLKLENGDAG
jgi:TolA-binding protein